MYRLLKDDFPVTLYNQSEIPPDSAVFSPNTTIARTVDEAYESDVIFFAVPIDAFERVIKDHKKYFQPRQLLIDVLSVKMHQEKILRKYLRGSSVRAILTHPMFGPDSSKNGFDGLPMIMDKFTADKNNYDFWKQYFLSKKLRIVEMSAKEHDRLAANSQGLTHFIGRLLELYRLKPTPIDSLGTKKLLEVMDQTCHDSWQLFENLQHFNPYTKRMRIKLGDNYDRLFTTLLPKQVKPKVLTIGIQGGRGSFNEQAVMEYVKNHHITKWRIKYLYTSMNVLIALHAGDIDCGQFAIHNSVGGIVEESVQAMAQYKFKIIEEFAIKISHALMIRCDAKLSDITTIMTHPQVFAQCKHNLSLKYPKLKQMSGKGKYIDQALVAKGLAENKIDTSIATIGSSRLAKLYHLQIIEDNLEDIKDNFTSFLVVSRL